MMTIENEMLSKLMYIAPQARVVHAKVANNKKKIQT